MNDNAPVLKGYVLDKILGKGTYATVYHAYKTSNASQISAVKCIERKRIVKSRTAADNLISEISLLKKLNHPHIVTLHDFMWDSSTIFLIMEFCSGGDLMSYMNAHRGKMDEKTAKHFFRQLSCALFYLHQQNVAHMDLKPHNILLVSRDQPILKVADFGFAQLLDFDERMNSIRGSPLYMAPEIVKGLPYDASVDLWSAGTILYEILYGSAPFASSTMDELLTKLHSTDSIKIPSTYLGRPISKECRSLLHALLQRNPKDRISFEKFFQHAFVDMEHFPSPDSLKKAEKLAKTAGELESSNPKEAVRLYTEALAHFLSAIKYERDSETRNRIKSRANYFLEKAEKLKKPKFNSTTDAQRLYYGEFTTNPKLKKAFLMKIEADTMLANGHFQLAREQYMDVSEIFLKAVQAKELSEDRVKLVTTEIDSLLQIIEDIDDFLKQKNSDTTVSMFSTASETFDSSKCCIQ